MIELHLTTTEVDFILGFEPADFGGYRTMAESLLSYMHRVQGIIEDGLERDWSDGSE